MKKILFAFALLILSVSAKAQFEFDKKYVSASLSGLNLSYNDANKLSFGVQVKGGYFVEDNWQVNGVVGFDHAGKGAKDVFTVGAGGRYYVQNNGLFLGANAKIVLSSGYTDVLPGVEFGYAFFINDKVTIEPTIYYNQSLKSHKENSTVGLAIGLGLYI